MRQLSMQMKLTHWSNQRNEDVLIFTHEGKLTNDENIAMRFVLSMLREKVYRSKKCVLEKPFCAPSTKDQRAIPLERKPCEERRIVKHSRILCRNFPRLRRICTFKEKFQEVVDRAKKKSTKTQDCRSAEAENAVRHVYHKLIQGR